MATLLTGICQELLLLPAKSDSDPTSEIFGAVVRFTTDISAHIRGNADLVVERRGMLQRLLAAYRDFAADIRSTVPVFDARKDAGHDAGGINTLTDLDCDGEREQLISKRGVKIDEVMTTALEYVPANESIILAT